MPPPPQYFDGSGILLNLILAFFFIHGISTFRLCQSYFSGLLIGPSVWVEFIDPVLNGDILCHVQSTPSWVSTNSSTTTTHNTTTTRKPWTGRAGRHHLARPTPCAPRTRPLRAGRERRWRATTPPCMAPAVAPPAKATGKRRGVEVGGTVCTRESFWDLFLMGGGGAELCTFEIFTFFKYRIMTVQKYYVLLLLIYETLLIRHKHCW